MGWLRYAKPAYSLTSTFLNFMPEQVSEQRNKALSPILHRQCGDRYAARPILDARDEPTTVKIEKATVRRECPKKGTELFVENKFGVCYFGTADISRDALCKSSAPVIRIDCRSSSLFAIRQALFRLAVCACPDSPLPSRN
jgi:hypothetical protein